MSWCVGAAGNLEFYSAIAQLIPILLLVLMLEPRLFGVVPFEVRRVLAVVAFSGETSALVVLYRGRGDFFSLAFVAVAFGAMWCVISWVIGFLSGAHEAKRRRDAGLPPLFPPRGPRRESEDAAPGDDGGT